MADLNGKIKCSETNEIKWIRAQQLRLIDKFNTIHACVFVKLYFFCSTQITSSLCVYTLSSRLLISIQLLSHFIFSCFRNISKIWIWLNSQCLCFILVISLGLLLCYHNKQFTIHVNVNIDLNFMPFQWRWGCRKGTWWLRLWWLSFACWISTWRRPGQLSVQPKRTKSQ